MTGAAPKIRVLVVDDSVVIRKLVTSAVEQADDLAVIGTAANGKLALAKLNGSLPDVIILDVEMPEMDGLQTLKAIRARFPKLPVIMFSTRTERGASTTIEALTAGASDYVTKPSNVGDVMTALSRVRDELVPKIRALVTGRSTPPPAAVTQRKLGPARSPVEIVAIGSSTGGPAALSAILAALPGWFPVPIVLVQHMLPTFTQHFAQRLASLGPLKVVEAAGGEVLLPGHVYLARGDHHMVVERQRADAPTLALDRGPVENFCRPAVDVLFRSVAKVYGAATLGVVLTGMGQDGLAGSDVIQAAGGNVIVQDEATSTVWGMPGFVAKAGLANAVLPLGGIANELVRRVKGAAGTQRIAIGGRS